MLKSFGQNKDGRDLIVGDIHGHFTKLKAALDALGFDPEVDRLFSVGDLVDRGPESDLADEWAAKPWFHPVRGNHEQMAIDYAAGLLQGGTGLYVQNGGGWNVSNPPERSKELGAALSALPVAIELETADGLVGIVHADCPSQSWQELRARLADKDEDFVQACLWSRGRIKSGDSRGVDGVYAVVVGHTPLQRPSALGNVIHIDTGACFGHDFTILDAATLAPAEAVIHHS